ncbi:hypothetical protein RND81_02G203600 [Saponaria officinalis]|uniref:Phytocyanin domain-containing protein n=1 Tax=Saponaria officinalis TaxID=3572 RepID=A0AAW1MRW6_SAPOF
MAFRTAFFVTLMVVALGFVSAQTTVDWTLGKSYTSYSTQSFKSGATIVFNYDTSLHNVLVVSKADYEGCTTSSPLQKFTDGKSTVTLKQGAMYFICGTPGHCSQGMKLQVNVGDSGSSTPATPTTPATPSTPTTTPPTDSTPTPTAPAPKDSSGAVAVQAAFGLSLVLGTLFAFMC